MKEIGEKLKNAREKMDISIEEASEDLKIETSILEKIEEGDKDSFKDVLYLKYYIRDYAKYLGLNSEEMVEEFNEYLFDYTSKISIDDIKNANKSTNDVKKISQVVSPYTVEKKQQYNIPVFLIYFLIILIIGVIVYCMILFFKEDTNNNDNIISYNEEVIYEFA